MGRVKEIYIEATELGIDPVEYLSMFRDTSIIQYGVDDETIRFEASCNKAIQERILHKGTMEE